MPQISIIVPVYKVEQYLHKCLDSILAQTFTDWECILIDDGSPDNSGAICDEYAQQDSRFRVIHQENKGSAEARNVGLDAARGEWIAFVDSDDWAEPDYLMKFIKIAKNNTAEIVSCDYFRNKSVFSGFVGKNSQEAIINIISGKALAFLWIKFFKKSLFDKFDIKFEKNFDVTEDVILCLKLFEISQSIIHISEPLYHYNIENELSLTFSLDQNKIEQIIFVTDIIEKRFCDLVFYHAILQRKVITKMWILRMCSELHQEYIHLYNEDALHRIQGITWKQRIILYLCNYNMYILLKMILKKKIKK